MQDSQGLRIGNFVKNSDGTICTVTALQKRDDGEIAISVSCIPSGSKFAGYVEELFPIELNQSVFAKAGFDISINTSLPERLGISKNGVIFNSEFQLCTNNNVVTIVSRRLKYAHQLQNLYYFITGVELEIEW